MLYVSGYKEGKSLYGVTDTDDGTTQWLSKRKLISVASKLASCGITISGVEGDVVFVITRSSNGQTYEERVKTWLSKMAVLGLSKFYVFDESYSTLVKYTGRYTDASVIKLPPVRRIGEKCFSQLGCLSCEFVAGAVISRTDIINMPYGLGITHEGVGIEFNSEIKEIGSRAFEGMYISSFSGDTSGVVSIGSLAFAGVASYGDNELHLSFPNVETIEVGAFAYPNSVIKDDSSLLSLSLGDKLEKIESCLCYGTALRDVKLPKNLREIDENAFRFCELRHVDFPKGITKIDSHAFFDTKLEDIFLPEGLEYIGTEAFAKCPIIGDDEELPLFDLVIPDSVCYIGSEAFSCCIHIRSIEMTCTQDTVLGFGIFQACGNLESVVIHGVVQRMDYLFKDCSFLKYVEMPEVGMLDTSVFSGCVSLEKIHIKPGAKRIGQRCFYNCSSLKEVNIPDTVLMISVKAFFGCDDLLNVVVPKSVIVCGDDAFSLKDTSYLRHSVTFLGDVNTENVARGREIIRGSSN